ncbi:hypothetical protein Cni_G26434 [Canna indica]|uniref:U-box domain-containing protein 4 n=1 Tax=Canna indica TaxID=4628 RepID=A0AAQ3QQH3_9LILI|nr:hypothetical protein Cni_G26434 [Canna indica]
MVTGIPPEFCRRMGRSCSGMSNASSAFSECRSERSDDPFLPGSPSAHGPSSIHRFLVSSSDHSDELFFGLVSALESPSVESQLRAAMEIRLLAMHSIENRLRIARAGAVRPLVALLSHPDPQLQEHGVTAVLNLSLCDENKAPLAGAGAVPHLVHALCVGTPVARENAACALFRLAQFEDLPAAIGCCGAIPPLIALLETGGARGKKDAATALFALLAVKDNAILAVEAGVVGPLLELMADFDSDMVDKAAYVLLWVLKTQKGRVTAVDEGAVAVLVEMLEMGSRKQKEVAVLSLLEICKECSDYRRTAVREGAIPPLVALSHAASSRTSTKKKVGNLTSSHRIQLSKKIIFLG